MNYLIFSTDAIGWLKVNIGKTFSKPANLVCGIPPGSTFGSLLYVQSLPQWFTKSWIVIQLSKQIHAKRNESSGIFIVNFDNISHLFLVFVFLTLNR